jgi:hypothetical protein
MPFNTCRSTLRRFQGGRGRDTSEKGYLREGIPQRRDTSENGVEDAPQDALEDALQGALQ